jgi:hypothetical protein
MLHSLFLLGRLIYRHISDHGLYKIKFKESELKIQLAFFILSTFLKLINQEQKLYQNYD